MFKVIDHTADIRLELEGSTPAALCQSLVAGICNLYAGTSALAADSAQPLQLEADSLEALLVALASEVIFRMEAGERLVTELIDADLRTHGDGYCLRATARVAGLPDGHPRTLEIKAATWHGLKVERRADKLFATILLDV